MQKSWLVVYSSVFLVFLMAIAFFSSYNGITGYSIYNLNDLPSMVSLSDQEGGEFDVFPPEVEIVSPINGSYYNVSDNLEISIDVHDDSVLEQINAAIIFPDNSEEILNLSNPPNYNGLFNTTYSLPNRTGLYAIEFEVIDSRENINDSEVVYFLVEDNLSPQVQVISGNLTNISLYSSAQVSANISDNVALENVKVYFNSTIEVLEFNASLNNGLYYSTLPSNSSGNFSYRFYANDSSGNYFYSPYYSFIVTNVSYGGPLTISVNSPSSVEMSANFDSTINLQNLNTYIGGSFNLTYWITSSSENTNYTKASQNVSVNASQSKQVSVNLKAPSSEGSYKLKSTVSWIVSSSTDSDSFSVVSADDELSSSSSSTSSSSGSTGSSGGSGGAESSTNSQNTQDSESENEETEGQISENIEQTDAQSLDSSTNPITGFIIEDGELQGSFLALVVFLTAVILLAGISVFLRSRRQN